MRKHSTFGKITFWAGCMFAILGSVGVFGLFDDSPLVPNPSFGDGLCTTWNIVNVVIVFLKKTELLAIGHGGIPPPLTECT